MDSPPSPSSEAHPAQRFVTFVCKKIDELAAKGGFSKLFTLSLPGMGTLAFGVTIPANAKDRMSLALLIREKKQAAVDFIWKNYREDKRVVFERGEMGVRDPNAPQAVSGK